MSEVAHDAGSAQEHEHGTIGSYVIGFILSLIFTLIPYSLIVKQSITGGALLMIIIVFAVMQMIIQVTFFLHLGRGPKPRWNVFFFISTVGIILVVVAGSIVIINNLHYNMAPSDQTKQLIANEGIYQVSGQLTGACHENGTNHQVIIKNGQATPFYTNAKKCDTLTFINEDSETREIAFGPHENHISYAGETELSAMKGRGVTMSLSETGTYTFHDHLHEETNGEFTVK